VKGRRLAFGPSVAREGRWVNEGAVGVPGLLRGGKLEERPAPAIADSEAATKRKRLHGKTRSHKERRNAKQKNRIHVPNVTGEITVKRRPPS